MGKHAVVLGASMGGLLAARVLADEFERVTVVERDRLSESAENRRGVPQGRHAHTLLPGGADVVDELFPGLLAELVVEDGATKLTDYTRLRFLPDGVHRLSPLVAVEPIHQPSRPLLESAVRTRLRGLAGVEILDGYAFVELTTNKTQDRVTGARVVRDGGTAEEVLTADLRRRYDRMRRFPQVLLVFGDAMCGFNPIYGQGMSVAAKEAILLRGCLRRGDRHLARRFFRKAAKPIGVAWRMAVGADLALPQVEGPRPAAVRLVNAYLHRVLVAAEHDPVVAARFLRVSAFLEKPARLMTLPIIARVIAGNRRAAPTAPAPVPVRVGEMKV
jgi:2-polyprenyl-6-methoxyphenol hydroxylase-like FAD-dependent oxidoreductase